MRRWICAAGVVALWPGCGSPDVETGDGDTGAGGAAQATPEPTSGKFDGSYEVPVPAELTEAATYPLENIEWRVHEGTVELDYELPKGLVGRTIRVRFTGPYDADASTVTLTGDAGTAECVIGADRIDCHETMRGLLPIEVDYDLVEDIAREEYDGPVQDRLDVAERFSGDPIGIAILDVGASRGGD